MVTALARRGPDAEGIHSWPQTVFGHRRLSIFDLSPAGRQPMLTDDGAVGVVFNGAVFNFLELRAELERLGHRFRSRTDTEVLIEGYRAWGMDDLVRRCRGMFAFALWDQSKATAWLVRDRLGVKPLLYRELPGSGLAFASTAEALAAPPDIRPSLDPDAVLEYLEFGYVTERRSIYAGVAKLPPGHILEWRNGASSLRRYWSLPETTDDRLHFEDAVAGTEKLLLEAVRLRLEADVPVGALLSGGIDSSLVCWAMAQLNARVESFTVGTPGDPADESGDAAATARQLGIPHRVVPFGATPPSLNELVSAYGEPFACSSAMGMLRVSQAVKPHATVLLTGDGGDDIYLGYPEHRHLWWAQQAAHWVPPGGASLWRHGIRPLVHRFPALRRPKHFLDYATSGLGAATRVRNGLPYFEERSLLGPRLLDRSPIWPRQIPLDPSRGRHVLADFTRYEYENRFVSEFLQKVDGGAMFYALEARSPFLDQTMWEFAARIPFRVRLRGGQLKAVLRELTLRRLGPAIAHRPKRGFTIPVERWLADRWAGEFRERLAQPRLVKEGWIEGAALAPAIQEGIVRNYVPTQLWHLLVLEAWLEHHPA